MSNIGNSQNGRAYVGTRAPQPPNITFVNRRPDQFDRDNYQVGDQWLYTDPTPGTNYEELWYLASLKGDGVISGKKAKWVLITGSFGGIVAVSADAGMPNAEPDINGVLAINGGMSVGNSSSNINTVVPGTGNQVFVNLNNSISQPNTNASGTAGMYSLGGQTFMHDYGVNNTWLGQSAGNLSLVGTANTGIGYEALNLLTLGNNNTAIGTQALLRLTTGTSNTAVGTATGYRITSGTQNVSVGTFSLFTNVIGDANVAIGYNALGLATTSGNTALGNETLTALTTGDNNIAIGSAAGDAYTDESDNIAIGNIGQAADAGVIRIGDSGLINLNYQAGITGVTVANPPTKKVMQVGIDGQLGEVALFSSDNTVVITETPGQINFQASGGGGGSGNPFAFSYSLPSSTANVVGNTAQVYQFGTTVVLNKIFDTTGGAFFPGDGVGGRATFTAPLSGKYYLYAQACGRQGASALSTSAVGIVTPTDTFIGYIDLSTLNTVNNLNSCAIVVSLNMGDVVTFNYSCLTTSNTVNTASITGDDNNLLGPAPGNITAGSHLTYFEGFLISQGSSGGDFSQPFHYIQVGDTGPGSGHTYGAEVILTQLFDVGSNVFPGDGVGGAAYFQAQATGVYYMQVDMVIYNATGAVPRITTPSKTFSRSNPGTGVTVVSLSEIVSLTAGDQVTFGTGSSGGASILTGNGTPTGATNNNMTGISGYRLA